MELNITLKVKAFVYLSATTGIIQLFILSRNCQVKKTTPAKVPLNLIQHACKDSLMLYYRKLALCPMAVPKDYPTSGFTVEVNRPFLKLLQSSISFSNSFFPSCLNRLCSQEHSLVNMPISISGYLLWASWWIYFQAPFQRYSVGLVYYKAMKYAFYFYFLNKVGPQHVVL